MSEGSPRRAMALFAATGLGWVLLEDVLGAMLSQPYPLMQVVWCRYASHLAILLALLAWRQPQCLWRTRRPGLQLARSMCMLVMPLSFVATLAAGASSRMTWSVFWFAPVLAVLIAWRFTPEPVDRGVARRAGWIAALCAVAAALMLWPPRWPAPGPWPLAALTMSLSVAVYVVMTRSLRGEAVQANLFYTAFGVFAVLTPFMPSIWVMPSLHDAMVVFGIGAVGLVSLFALDRAAAQAPLSLSVPGLYLYLPALVAVNWGLHGATSARHIAMALVIAAALSYLWRQLPAAGAGDATARA